jgi:hypothetical protein
MVAKAAMKKGFGKAPGSMSEASRKAVRGPDLQQTR